MTAGSSYTNFVTNGNVHQNAETFNPDLFNKVGAVKGYPGPSNSILAAAGDFGGKVVMKGGRKPSPGPDYHSFEDSDDLRAGTYGKNYAPVKSCNNNQCGGRRRGRGRRTMRKGRKSMRRGMRKTKRGMRQMKRGRKSVHKGRKSMKHHTKKHLRRIRRKSLSMLKDVRDLFKGGSPAEVPAGTTSNGYHQFMSNQPHTNVYGLDGNLSPQDNALANPMKIKVQNACASSSK